MILFDGIDIRTVAKVHIEDIRVSPIQFKPVARERAIDAGSEFVRNRCGNRTVAVTFAILTQDKNARQSALRAVSEWAKTDKEYKLEIIGHPDHYLMAVCTAKPEPSLRQWWESKLRLVFTCFDNPFWNCKIEKSVSCGTTFSVMGDAPPLMRIERTTIVTETNESYVMDDKTMTFSSIPVGDMVIDLNRQTATVDDVSIMQYYNPASRFIVPHTGAMKIDGTGTVVYRERWQ